MREDWEEGRKEWKTTKVGEDVEKPEARHTAVDPMWTTVCGLSHSQP